jgi:hypothetical protein
MKPPPPRTGDIRALDAFFAMWQDDFSSRGRSGLQPLPGNMPGINMYKIRLPPACPWLVHVHHVQIVLDRDTTARRGRTTSLGALEIVSVNCFSPARSCRH